MSDERRLSIRTLVIAAIASAAAAAITSQFWIRGTPIAAALTPVIVALVSELLHRPTERIAQRMTAETDALPEAAGADPPPPSEAIEPRPARDPDVRIYRAGRKRRIAWATVLGTGLLAFVIAAAVITIPEAISGSSLFHGDRSTTLGGAKKHRSAGPSDETAPVETTTETVTETAPPPQRTTPERSESTPRTTPTTPTTTTPQQRSTPPTSTTPQTTTPAPPSE